MKRFSSFIASFLSTTKVTDMTSLKSTTGTAPFKVPGLDMECFTWFKVFGDLRSGKRPLIALHGGPGVGYMNLNSVFKDCIGIFGYMDIYALSLILRQDEIQANYEI